jgi:hypothetical protein
LKSWDNENILSGTHSTYQLIKSVEADEILLVPDNYIQPTDKNAAGSALFPLFISSLPNERASSPT